MEARPLAGRVPFEATGVTLLGIASTSLNHFTAHWSAPVSVDTLATPDDALVIDGVSPDGIAVIDSTHTDILVGGESGSGNPWSITAQPNWLLTPVIVPASGTTT